MMKSSFLLLVLLNSGFSMKQLKSHGYEEGHLEMTANPMHDQQTRCLEKCENYLGTTINKSNDNLMLNTNKGKVNDLSTEKEESYSARKIKENRHKRETLTWTGNESSLGWAIFMKRTNT